MWSMSLGDMPQAEKLCGHRRITLPGQLISAWYRFTSPKPTLLTPQLAAELFDSIRRPAPPPAPDQTASSAAQRGGCEP